MRIGEQSETAAGRETDWQSQVLAKAMHARAISRPRVYVFRLRGANAWAGLGLLTSAAAATWGFAARAA